jgi:hypothetical protein
MPDAFRMQFSRNANVSALRRSILRNPPSQRDALQSILSRTWADSFMAQKAHIRRDIPWAVVPREAIKISFYIITCLQKNLTKTHDNNHNDDGGYHYNIRPDLPVPKPAACSGPSVFFNCHLNFSAPVVYVPLSASEFCPSVRVSLSVCVTETPLTILLVNVTGSNKYYNQSLLRQASKQAQTTNVLNKVLSKSFLNILSWRLKILAACRNYSILSKLIGGLVL